jgi:Nucleoporin protein Ndc1-Nup
MVLNERPIFLRSNFFLLSLMQAAYHLWWDVSRIKLPRVEPAAEPEHDSRLSVVPPAQRVRNAIAPMLASTAGRTGVATFCNLFIYALFLRQTAYHWSRDIGRIIWNIARNAEPGFVPPYHWTLLVRSFVSGTLMIFLWDFSNFVFSLYVAQEPVKKDKPLTDDSPDPNGSLLNGLKSKKELVRVSTYSLVLDLTNYPLDVCLLGTPKHQLLLQRPAARDIRGSRPRRGVSMDASSTMLLSRDRGHRRANQQQKHPTAGDDAGKEANDTSAATTHCGAVGARHDIDTVETQHPHRVIRSESGLHSTKSGLKPLGLITIRAA